MTLHYYLATSFSVNTNRYRLFFWFLFGLSNFSNAQQSPESIPWPPESPFYEYSETRCENLYIEKNFIVRYEKDATAYIQVQGNINFIGSVYIENWKNDIDLDLTSGELVIKGLVLDRTYSLYYRNLCDEISFLGTIDTRKSFFEDGVIVSEDFLQNIMVPLSIQESGNFLDIIYNDTSINYLEKLSTFQDIYLKDHLISSDLVFGEYPVRQAEEQAGRRIPPPPDKCDCSLLNTTVSNKPGIPVIQGEVTLPETHIFNFPTTREFGYLESFGRDTSGVWRDDTGFSGHKYSKGPARHQDAWAWGRHSHRETYRERSGNFSSDEANGVDVLSTNRARLNIYWYCWSLADIWQASDCGCTKNLFYTANYETLLRSYMDLPSCLFCGNKGGYARAEDYAALVFSSALNNDFEILALGRSLVESGCNEHFNKQWLFNILELAETFAVLYFVDSGAISEETIAEIADEIIAIIEEPIEERRGCTTVNEDATLITMTDDLMIRPNDLYQLNLYFGGLTEVMGYSSWNGFARISSDFNLALRLKPGFDSEQSRSCCTNGMGAWSMADYPDSPTGASANFDEVDAFFEALGMEMIPSQFGFLWDPACDETETPKVIWNLHDPDDQYELSLLFDGGNCQIFNIGGVKIHDAIIYQGFDLFEGLPHSMPSGMYIVTYSKGGDHFSGKFLVTK